MFYVTAIDNKDRVFVMSGPHDSKDNAESIVKDVKEIVIEYDRRGIWMSWGVSRIDSEGLIGRLEQLGIGV